MIASPNPTSKLHLEQYKKARGLITIITSLLPAQQHTPKPVSRATNGLYSRDFKEARALLLAKTGPECQRCHIQTPAIQAHHLHYQNHNDLIALCPECHYVADMIRNLDYSVLEKSAAINWPALKTWMEKTFIWGWARHGEWELVVIFFQTFLLTETLCTVSDVICGSQIKVGIQP